MNRFWKRIAPRRRMADRQNIRPDPVKWSMLLNGGVVVALDGTVDLATLDVRLETRGGETVHVFGVPAQSTLAGDTRVLSFVLPASFFAQEVACRIRVGVAGTEHRSVLFEIGVGRFICLVDQVDDYALVGWASPLFDAPAFEIELFVDGRPCVSSPPNRFRKELMSASRHGGWNGFALPLPGWALDGLPHRLAVRCGEVMTEYGQWTAKPTLAIESVAPGALSGWLVDTALASSPITVRLVGPDGQVAVTRTFARSDVESATGATFSGFAFVGVDVAPGSNVCVGGDAPGRVLATLEMDRLADRVNRVRRASRRMLLSEPASSYPTREALRHDAIGVQRGRPEGVWAYALAPRVETAATQVSMRHARETAGNEAQTVPGQDTADWGAGQQLARVDHKACIVVPVYKGVEDLRACIESLLPQLDPDRCRLLVVNDASPEPAVRAYLGALAARRLPGVTVLDNETNLGFVGSVNRGFAQLAPDEDVVLVNSDTILPRCAIAKLAAACHRWPGVASVTPMSNNGTILSFPAPLVPNPPFDGMSVDQLDAAFEAAGEPPVEIPTAIGFCVYLNRKALVEVGAFSAAWGKGYCEEVEWCLVARDLGWRHLAALDVFVVHEGSVSFGVQERSQILVENHAKLERLFPEYLDEVREFGAVNALEEARCRVLVRLLAARFRDLVVHVSHSLGGGTKSYIDSLLALPRDAAHEACTMQPDRDDLGHPILRFRFHSAGAQFDLSADRFDWFVELLATSGLAILWHINARIGFRRRILRAISAGPAPYVVTLHDFQWYCAPVHLVNETGFYCGEPPPEVCQLCVRRRSVHDFADDGLPIQTDLKSVLAFHRAFLAGAEQLIAPSRDTAARYRKRFGLENVVYKPHPEAAARGPARLAGVPQAPARSRDGLLRIAVVGAIGEHKGFELVRRVAEIVAHRQLPIFIRVIGTTADNPSLMNLPNIDVTGAYEESELRALLDEFRPDFVWFASVWPETYSYVLTEVWRAGYPVVAFDFGAVAERIREAGGGLLIDPTRDCDELVETLLNARDALSLMGGGRVSPGYVGTLESYYGLGTADLGGAPAA